MKTDSTLSTVLVAIWPLDEGAPESREISALARTRAGWTNDTQVFAYTEAVSACALTRTTMGEWTAPVDGIEGRLFNEHAEIRWRMAPTGALQVWVVRETSDAGDPLAQKVNRLDRRYYLIGRGTEEPGEFREARYPGITLSYPVDGASADSNTRAYITVAEYRRVRPAWPVDEDETGPELDGPLLVAHRFVGVDMSAAK